MIIKEANKMQGDWRGEGDPVQPPRHGLTDMAMTNTFRRLQTMRLDEEIAKNLAELNIRPHPLPALVGAVAAVAVVALVAAGPGITLPSPELLGTHPPARLIPRRAARFRRQEFAGKSRRWLLGSRDREIGKRFLFNFVYNALLWTPVMRGTGKAAPEAGAEAGVGFARESANLRAAGTSTKPKNNEC
ncbi:MAG: hypothetical protein ACLS37_12710 [Alistipes sp.]